MKVRHKARAVLFDGDQLVFLRRGWPGGSAYCTTVGGGVEPGDTDPEAALRREAMEELGATIGPVEELMTLTDPGGATTVVEHYFLADITDMDLSLRHGPELADPDTGDHEPVRVPLDVRAVSGLNLQPPALRDHVIEHIGTWAVRPAGNRRLGPL